MLRTSLRVLATLVAVMLAATAFAAGSIPLDSDGLPAWSVKQWTDFPVRLELADHAALTDLLSRVPLAGFHREDVRPEFQSGKIVRVVVETRVTDAEYAALTDAGFRPTKLRDIERENREASERLWADMYAGKADGLRTDPLNYVPTNDQTGTMLQNLAATYPDKARYFSYGSSVQGRTIHGLVISDNVNVHELEPEVRYTSSMHGDEITGMVLCLNLAYYLLEHYGEAGYEDGTDLVDNYELHLVPAYNPDGTYLHQRYNANGVDLNRNFLEPGGTHSVREQENIVFMNYCLPRHFVVSINYHGGALVMNYPWDYTYTLAPDDAALQLLSLEYSTRNLPMYNGAFNHGITNGAEWYVATGTLQDWCYDQTDDIDVTCEVSNTKWPSNSLLPGFWDDNRESMIAYARSARWGISGVVTDAGTDQPLDATIAVAGIDMDVHTDPAHGDYYKLLHDGTFDVTVSATGYVPQTFTGVTNTWGTVNTLDVALEPLPEGLVTGTVTDLEGQGLDAYVSVATYPAGEIIESIPTEAAGGGAFSVTLPFGDYTFTATAVDHFEEMQQVTVGAEPVVLTFELGGTITTYPINEDFEAGPGSFVGDWIIGTPGYDSVQCLTDSEGNYPNNALLIATLDTTVDLADVMDPQVSFYAKWSIENNWDAVFFEVSTDGGVDWDALAVPGRTQPASGQGTQRPAGTPCFEGNQGSWVPCSVDLSPYIGQSDVRFRFRLETDTSQVYDGFYVDDFMVRITTEEGGTTPVDTLPPLKVHVQAYPNPFNPGTTVQFTNPRPGHVDVAIFDLQGRRVRTLVSATYERGIHEARWDGNTDSGRRAGSGVYMARLITGSGVTATKLMLVK